jgi:beta-glucosidase
MSYASYLVVVISFVSFVCGSPRDPADRGDAASVREDTPAALQRRDNVPAGYYAAPYYPTPKGGWVSSWANAYTKAQKVVANMTLAEKVNLTTGTGIYMVCSALILSWRRVTFLLA